MLAKPNKNTADFYVYHISTFTNQGSYRNFEISEQGVERVMTNKSAKKKKSKKAGKSTK